DRDALVQTETAGRDGRPVQDDRGRSSARGVLDGGDRIVACANERRTPGDDAGALRVEEGPHRRRGLEAIRARAGATLARGNGRKLARMPRKHGAGKRKQSVDDDVEAVAEDDTALLRMRPQVGGADAECGRRGARAREAPEGRPRRAVV